MAATTPSPSPTDCPPGPRRRDATATRAALLAAACRRFGQDGYDHTSVRDVAADVGVNQALVFRYFGSKQDLFWEAVAGPGIDELFAATGKELTSRVLTRLLDSDCGPATGGGALLSLLRSANDDDVRQELRRRLGHDCVERLAELAGSDCDHAEARLQAELFVALVLGIGVMRWVVGTPELAAATIAELVPPVTRVAEALLPGCAGPGRTQPEPVAAVS